jgi:LmbE family N-acetylglucosaminyl deacetylase
MRRILVISPHTDDELFGCGGTLLKLKERGDQIKLAVMSCTPRFLFHLNRVVSSEEQWAEFANSANILSTESPEWYQTSENKRLEQEPTYEVIRWLDKLIMRFKPTTIFIPEPSYHQEHQIVYKTSIAACRPTYGDRAMQDVLLYEIPTSTWGGPDLIYKPNIYVDIAKQIDSKIDIFKNIYKVQHTEEKRNLLGEKGIRAHARYRGIESSQEYAESFMLIRSTSIF